MRGIAESQFLLISITILKVAENDSHLTHSGWFSLLSAGDYSSQAPRGKRILQRERLKIENVGRVAETARRHPTR
jgi:hypothetical protein